MNAPAQETLRAPRPTNPLAPYLVLAGLWLLTLTIVPPRGDFPLNDDWMYAKVVKHLVETGEYQSNPYIDPTFILQAYWGAGFVKIFGFSFETLRASSLLLALIAIWAAHWCAREAGLNARWALLVAIAVLVNPLFLNLSNTFMTDVPFLALCTLSAAAYLRGFNTHRARWIAVATCIIAAAYFVRQFAVVLMLAAAIALLHPIQMPPRTRAKFWAVFVSILIVFAALRTVIPTGGLGLGGAWDWARLGDTWFQRALEILRYLTLAYSYLSVFLAPIAVAWAMSLRRSTEPAAQIDAGDETGNSTTQSIIARRFSPRATLLVAALSLFIAWLIIPQWPHRLPGVGNLLVDLGVGPLLMPGMLDGTTIMAGTRIGAGPWRVITALAFVGAGAITALLIRTNLRALMPAALREPGRRTDFFLALWSLGMLLMLAMPPVAARFDRYFLTALIPTSILTVRWIAARASGPAIAAYVTAAALHIFSLACLQDYLAWNTARWEGLASLQRDHQIPLDQINGGYEFNGWYHSDHFAEESRRAGVKVFGPRSWWTLEDNYRVSLRTDKHFEVIGTKPYFSWLGMRRHEMLMLKRIAPDEDSELFN